MNEDDQNLTADPMTGIPMPSPNPQNLVPELPAPAPAPAPAPQPDPVVADPMTGIPVPLSTPPAEGTPEFGSLGQAVGSAYQIPALRDATIHHTALAQQPDAAPEAAPAGGAKPYPNEVNMTQTVLRPGTAGGDVVTGKEIDGFTPAAQTEMRGAGDAVAGAQAAAGGAELDAQQKYADYVNAQASKMYGDAQAADLATQAAIVRNQMVQKSLQGKMQDVAAFKPDRAQLFEGTAGGFRALSAVFAMALGGALQGLQGGPNQAVEAIYRTIDDNVKDQVRQNSQVFEELKMRLGDEQSAELALRQKHLENLKDLTAARAMGQQGAQIQAAVSTISKRTDLEIANGKLALLEKLEPHEKLKIAHQAPTPAQILTLDKQQQMLAQLQVKPEDYQKFMEHKVDEKNSVGDLINTVRDEHRDINTLEALRAENGGKLPGFDSVIDWTRSEHLRALGARLGFTKAVDAGKVYAQIKRQTMERAKGLGRVTEVELDNIGQQMGVNGDQLLDFMHESADHANARLVNAANGSFQGRGQKVIDIASAGTAATPGMRMGGLTPR